MLFLFYSLRCNFLVKGNFQKKFELLEKKIQNINMRFVDIFLKQLKNAKTMKELKLIEKTLLLLEHMDLAQDTDSDSLSKNKKQELLDIDDPNEPAFIQLRFAIRKEDYIWRINSSVLPRSEKEFLLLQIERIEKDNSTDYLQKWELLNSMKKYLPKNLQG